LTILCTIYVQFGKKPVRAYILLAQPLYHNISLVYTQHTI